jgi:hypothetical protein
VLVKLGAEADANCKAVAKQFVFRKSIALFPWQVLGKNYFLKLHTSNDIIEGRKL